jgi:diguanylate cyclase (GGDEF)-like protein
MLPKLAQAITDNIDEIARRWVEVLRRSERTEVHKTMLTAEIVSGTKGMLANLAAAIAEQSAPEGETIPVSLVQRSRPPLSQEIPPARAARGSKLITTALEGSSLDFALEAAVTLGRLRQKQDYQIHEVLLELTALRQALWDTLHAIEQNCEVDPGFDIPRYLDRLFDELLLHSIEAFYESSVRELEKRAIRDPLTDLYNKEYFAQRLNEELRRALRYRQPLTLAMLDMDHLKEINDTYGHQAGDSVIKAVTRAICDTCRQIDIPCRYGGDEFAVILPETSKPQAVVFAERTLNTLRGVTVALLHTGSLTAHGEGKSGALETIVAAPTVSIGLASFPEDGRNPDTLISKADEALYSAKRQGRNMVIG